MTPARIAVAYRVIREDEGSPEIPSGWTLYGEFTPEDTPRRLEQIPDDEFDIWGGPQPRELCTNCLQPLDDHSVRACAEFGGD